MENYIEGTDRNDTRLDQEMNHLHFELVCQLNPRQIISLMKSNILKYELEFSLEKCREYQVYDALGYILDKMGDIPNSIKSYI